MDETRSFSVAACLVGVFAWACFMGLQMVPEGYVGVYYRAGALLQTVSPAWNARDACKQMRMCACGTSGGVLIYFERIEVVNILDMESAHTVVKRNSLSITTERIYNKIHHELNQFCSVNTLQDVYIKKFDQIDENLKSAACKRTSPRWLGRPLIVAVRVTKPKIPETLRKNYESMEAEKTQLNVLKRNWPRTERQEGRHLTAEKAAQISRY
uniref:PHB domain-containing protein n=1 Tax=Macrostomum lignano TaxID=282301 RepID=A0A1I8FIG2_9PLAT